jgi:protein SCO1
MKHLAALGLTLLILQAPASAAFTAAELDPISAAPAPGAALPLRLGFIDESGRPTTLAQALAGKPAVVIFADYTCHTLCGPILDFAVAGLGKTGLQPGQDYRLLVIGLDPKDGPDAARAMRTSHLDADDSISGATVLLTGTEDAIRSATGALGYRYAYDAEHDQFAHPAAAYITDAQGRVARMLSGLGLSGGDLRLALVEAGRGAVGTLADRLHLLCYGYDPVRGIYTERITLFLQLAAGATVLVMTGGILVMLAIERRKGLL